MAPKPKIQNADEAIRWIKEGLTYKQMTELHEQKYNITISPSGWSYFRKQHGLDARAVSDKDLMPWALNDKHRNNYYLYCLRQEARRRAGKRLDPKAEVRVNAFLRDLKDNNAVVYYDPETDEGFFLVPREEQDGTGLVRRPPKTKARKRRASDD